VKPLFITVEGLDGSGKSTQLRYASSWLEERGLGHLVTQEPGGTPLGDAIRAVFLNLKDEWTTVDGTVEALLIFASRRQHLLEVIDSTLAAGRHVLCDRFTDSTLAYQGYGRGVSLEILHSVDDLATGCRVPDRTLLFDLPAAAARDRGQSPGRRSEPGGVDRLDAEGLVFYERVRQGYLELAMAEPERFVVIDASGSIEQTRDRVDAALTEIFGGV
jgi:dTMP kinase